MKLLLDAHTFLWFVWDEVQLTNDAKALIVNPTNQKPSAQRRTGKSP
jgi:PIN domain nuclease of toxin-antitoxin system